MRRNRRYSPPLCPDHKTEMVLTPSQYRKFWTCIMQPFCDFKIGAHPDGRPLGFPVDQETRDLRHEVHKICERFWDWNNHGERSEMYRFLQKHTKHGHIGQMDKAELTELKQLLTGQHNKNDWTRL